MVQTRYSFLWRHQAFVVVHHHSDADAFGPDLYTLRRQAEGTAPDFPPFLDVGEHIEVGGVRCGAVRPPYDDDTVFSSPILLECIRADIIIRLPHIGAGKGRGRPLPLPHKTNGSQRVGGLARQEARPGQDSRIDRQARHRLTIASVERCVQSAEPKE